MSQVDRSEITPEYLFLSRREFIAGAATLGAGAVLAACAAEVDTPGPPDGHTAEPQGTPPAAPGDEQLTLEDSINSYNNYYEFTTSKADVQRLAADLVTSPWVLEVGGLAREPRTYLVQDLMERFPPEERVYRMRCVEGWSMVIPWLGFPLHGLLAEVQPTEEARYVRFEGLLDPAQMPGQRGSVYDWPYVEGLRLDEAKHHLTILAMGLYGKPLTPQMGAPLRLVVPWKYGFKSTKAIVKIDLVAEMPVSLWMRTTPDEYGFYANVNPRVDHPRWSQATERRLGEGGRRETLLFNGYAEEVAHLYDGMDLRKNF